MVFLKNKKKDISEKKFQKNRFFKLPKNIKFIYGDNAIINLKEGRLELIQINGVKKFLKKLIKKKTPLLSFNREKIWYFGRINFFLQKKSKNSRMGKGKGLFERKVIRIKKNFIIFEFKGVNFFKLNWFLKKINKISNLRFKLISNKPIFYKNWFKLNSQSYFNTKYLHV